MQLLQGGTSTDNNTQTNKEKAKGEEKQMNVNQLVEIAAIEVMGELTLCVKNGEMSQEDAAILAWNIATALGAEGLKRVKETVSVAKEEMNPIEHAIKVSRARSLTKAPTECPTFLTVEEDYVRDAENFYNHARTWEPKWREMVESAIIGIKRAVSSEAWQDHLSETLEELTRLAKEGLENK